MEFAGREVECVIRRARAKGKPAEAIDSPKIG
jgi:hypothetical protein